MDKDGPLTVETLSSPHPLYEVYLEAAQSVGIPLNPDFNGELQEGCGYFQQTTKKEKDGVPRAPISIPYAKDPILPS